jgi:hypothetical protein
VLYGTKFFLFRKLKELNDSETRMERATSRISMCSDMEYRMNKHMLPKGLAEGECYGPHNYDPAIANYQKSWNTSLNEILGFQAVPEMNTLEQDGRP